MIITAQQLKSWMKANLLCEALRAARLFEPDRNEEKWTNEHVYWEQRMSIFFFLKTNQLHWSKKHKASRRENNQTSDLSGNFFILWLVSFDPKFSPCFCMFWSLGVLCEILSGLDECIHYRLPGRMPGFLSFISCVFYNSFFDFFSFLVFSAIFFIKANRFK